MSANLLAALGCAALSRRSYFISIHAGEGANEALTLSPGGAPSLDGAGVSSEFTRVEVGCMSGAKGKDQQGLSGRFFVAPGNLGRGPNDFRARPSFSWRKENTRTGASRRAEFNYIGANSMGLEFV